MIFTGYAGSSNLITNAQINAKIAGISHQNIIINNNQKTLENRQYLLNQSFMISLLHLLLQHHIYLEP
jgi:hypothetical protein